MRAVDSGSELYDLPVGSVIVDLGPNRSESASPVVACKALDGSWQVMGQVQGKTWSTEQVLAVTEGHDLVVVYDVFESVLYS